MRDMFRDALNFQFSAKREKQLKTSAGNIRLQHVGIPLPPAIVTARCDTESAAL